VWDLQNYTENTQQGHTFFPPPLALNPFYEHGHAIMNLQNSDALSLCTGATCTYCDWVTSFEYGGMGGMVQAFD